MFVVSLNPTCNSRGDNDEGQGRRGNGEDLGRGLTRESQSCEDIVEEEDGIKSGSRKKT